MDNLSQFARQDHIRVQLGSLPDPKVVTTTHVKICCPFHGEKTPSASIRWDTGYLNCFGCGHKAKFDEWAEHAGLQPFIKGPPKDRYAQNLFAALMQGGDAYEQEEQPEDEEEQEEDETPGFEANPSDSRKDDELPFKFWTMRYRDLPAHKRWRTIKTSLLRKLGGKQAIRYFAKSKRWDDETFVYLPVMVHGEQKGYFLARTKKVKDKPSYLLAPSTGDAWAKNWGLWPFDYSVNLMRKLGKETIVVVEGQRDALRLLSMGIPAVCMFGSKSWSENKSRILEVSGVRRVIQFFDGDDAGISATEFTRPFLTGMFDTKSVNLWKVSGSPYLDYAHIEDEKERKLAADADGVEFWDPGACPEWIVNRIKDKWLL